MPVLTFWDVAARAEAFKGQTSLHLECRPITAAGLTGKNPKEATSFVHDGSWCPSEFVSRAFFGAFSNLPSIPRL